MKKLLLVLMVSVVLVLSVACGEDENLPPADEIMANILENQQNMESYQFNVDMTADMAMIGEDLEGCTPGNMNMSGTMSGAADIVNYQMKVVMDFDVSVPDEDPISMEMEMYLVDDMMYMMMDMPMMPAQWIKSDVPEYDLDQMDIAGAQMDLLEMAYAKILGSEKVNGEDCYILKIIPDMDEMWDMVMEQSQVPIGEMPDFPIENLSDMFKDVSMKVWVTKNTFLVVKSEIDMSMEITGETMGMPEEEGGFTMDMNMSMLMYDHNQPVTIELPPEAEDAVYQSMY